MQQQEFIPPEREAGYTREVNNDPREQQQQASYSDVDMYQGGQKIYPQQPQRQQRRSWLFMVIFILVGLMALGGLNAMFRARSAFEYRPILRNEPISAPMSQTSAIPVSGIPRLVINVDNIPVHIHTGGDASKVLINADARAMNVIPIASNTGTIVQVTENRDLPGDDSHPADLDITVADKADVVIHSADGSVDINGVSGQIDVVSNDGQVNVSNVQGQLNIMNQDGKVAIDQFTGQVQLNTGDASIDMNNVTLNGSSSMKTVDGSFSFDGSLAAGGTYSIESRDGSVDVTLPADSSFKLLPTTSGGSLQNDFGGTTVGNAPYSILSIRTGDGSITLHKK